MDVMAMPRVTIPGVNKEQGVARLGCWLFGGAAWSGQGNADSDDAISASLAHGMTYLHTAKGQSKRVLAPFLNDHRDMVYLATKGNTANASAEEIRSRLNASLEDLGELREPGVGRGDRRIDGDQRRGDPANPGHRQHLQVLPVRVRPLRVPAHGPG